MVYGHVREWVHPFKSGEVTQKGIELTHNAVSSI